MKKINEETTTADVPTDPVKPAGRRFQIRTMRYCNKCNSVFWDEECESCSKKDK